MRNAFTITTMLGTVMALSAALPAYASRFNTFSDCVVGKRVLTSDNHKGKITRLDRPWSYCYVLQDDTGKEVSYLYSLLEAEAKSTEQESNDKLVTGNYNCTIGGQGAGEMRVTGRSTYETAGKKGTYRLEPSGKIVFESGPFSTYNAKLLSGRRIGMNLNGSTFYNMTCDPVR